MNPLASFVLAAMMAWVPVTDHSYYEAEDKTQARYEEIAQVIEEVALDPAHLPLFDGEDGRIKTALLLASIASTESFYARDAVTCKKSGDNGLAWGPWQTHSGKKRTCSSLIVAAGIAYEMIKTSFDACKGYQLIDRLTLYTSGGLCRNDSWPSRYRMRRALNWYNKHQSDLDVIRVQVIAQ